VIRKWGTTARACFALAFAAAHAAAVWPYDRPARLAADEVLEKVNERYAALAGFRAAVTTAVTSGALGESSSQSGVMYFRAPDRVRVEYGTPFAQTIIYDGSYMYVITAGQNQVIRYAGASLGGMISLPQALATIREQYDAALASETAGGLLELHFVARAGDQLFKKVYVWVDAGTFLASRLELYDDAGGSTSYRFSNYRLDPSFPADYFEFAAPPGAEIVDAGP
jgi:outer membrane lipoprotein carrier protein